MTAIVEAKPSAAAGTDVGVSDRRRPGRSSEVSPALIPLLRTNEAATLIDFEEDADQSAGIRGLLFGILLSVPLWVAIAYLGTWFLT
ncbi:MAG: hypothetical protein RQ966_18160 [Acetobacteraceae bacterium]|nr:hypothetical protein [Acetobacteraceae bacterium]